ncbi:MAG: pilus assembly protein TadG-related protein [Actinomycetota bacterium]
MRPERRIHDERGGIITGSLLRYAVILVILGLVAIEGGSIIFTVIRLQNAADAAALRAADEWQSTGDIRTARRAARAELDTKGQEEATITAIEADGAPTYELRLTAQKEAPTILVGRIGFLEDLGVVDIEADARPIEAGV